MGNKNHKLTLRMDDEAYDRLDALQKCTGRSKSALINDFVMKGAVSLESKKTIVQKLSTMYDAFNRQRLDVNQQLSDIRYATEQLALTCRGRLAEGDTALASLLTEQANALRKISSYCMTARAKLETEVAYVVNSEIGN